MVGFGISCTSLRGDAEHYDSTPPTGVITLPSAIPSTSTILTATFSESIHDRFLQTSGYSNSSHTVTVQATANGKSVTTSFIVIVNNVDRAPTISPTNDITLNENATKTITIFTSDPDGDTITYSLTQKSSFATIAGNIITLSPTFSDSDNYTVTVQLQTLNHLQLNLSSKITKLFLIPN